MSIRIEDLNIDFSDVSIKGAEPLPAVHPGDILLHDFMEPLGLSANALAKALHVPTNRITAIIKHERAVTAETALRLARHFGTTAQFWLNLQQQYDLEVAERELADQIKSEVKPRAA